MLSYVTLSRRFFGDIIELIRPYFMDIKGDLQKAGMNYTVDEWLSVALMTTTITFIIENVIIAFLLGFLGFHPLTAVLLAFTLSLTASTTLFLLFYSYPVTKSKNRENKIKKLLPFSVSYLAAISSAKVPPIVLFKTLSGFKEYGEVAEEAATITKNVEVFGMTFLSAVKSQARKTPSRELKELLWGISNVISSGGDLSIFLKQKSDELMNDYRRRIRKYAQDLSLFVEIYLTLIITGSIFFIVLSSIISTISGGLGAVATQTMVVFILLPMISMGFILLIKSISPIE